MRQRLIPTLIVPAMLLSAALKPDTPPVQEPRQERIMDFSSDIVIHKDASLTVRATILVQALGHTIKRGIARDFLTTYKNRLGHRVKVDFEILEVRRDGHPEAYHTVGAVNGAKNSIGKKTS